jgi:hypothetical protein
MAAYAVIMTAVARAQTFETPRTFEKTNVETLKLTFAPVGRQ